MAQFLNGKWFSETATQWAPTRTSHDPTPPLPLESSTERVPGGPATYFLQRVASQITAVLLGGLIAAQVVAPPPSQALVVRRLEAPVHASPVVLASLLSTAQLPGSGLLVQGQSRGAPLQAVTQPSLLSTAQVIDGQIIVGPAPVAPAPPSFLSAGLLPTAAVELPPWGFLVVRGPDPTQPLAAFAFQGVPPESIAPTFLVGGLATYSIQNRTDPPTILLGRLVPAEIEFPPLPTLVVPPQVGSDRAAVLRPSIALETPPFLTLVVPPQVGRDRAPVLGPSIVTGLSAQASGSILIIPPQVGLDRIPVLRASITPIASAQIPGSILIVQPPKAVLTLDSAGVAGLATPPMPFGQRVIGEAQKPRYQGALYLQGIPPSNVVPVPQPTRGGLAQYYAQRYRTQPLAAVLVAVAPANAPAPPEPPFGRLIVAPIQPTNFRMVPGPFIGQMWVIPPDPTVSGGVYIPIYRPRRR